jgi:ATP-dependent DNA ligase
MSPPEPMLSASSRSWPSGSDWMLQPKWDGFRLLIEVAVGGRVRAWSRHGTSLTWRLGGLVEAFGEVPGESVFDGELVAVAERDGCPVQDFAAVSRAVIGGSTVAMSRLQFVAFDVLASAGEDLGGLPWRKRDRRLAEVLPASERIRRIQSQPASHAAHAAIVKLGFEGTVLKRPGAMYRPAGTPPGSSTRLATPRKASSSQSIRTATGTGMPLATSKVVACTPPLAQPRANGSGSPSPWSTRGSTPTGVSARPAWPMASG